MKPRPRYEELVRRIRELENGSLQERQAEDASHWEGLFSESVVDNLPVGFAYFDEEFVLLRCNRTYADFLRTYTPYDVDKARGMCHFDYKPGSAPYLEDWFRYVRDSGKSDTRYDLELWITQEGRAHVSYWDAHLSPLKGPNGRSRGVLMCCIDVTEKNLIKQAVRTHNQGLAKELRTMEELKFGLRALLKLREEDKMEVENKLLSNANQMVLPWIDRLRQSKLSWHQKVCVDIMESNLRKLVHPFSHKLTSISPRLTPTEIHVAILVEEGKPSKEIAALLGVSKESVDFHRNNIRKKLGLTGRKANLQTYLSAIVH